jgi:hypothetical protein
MKERRDISNWKRLAISILIISLGLGCLCNPISLFGVSPTATEVIQPFPVQTDTIPAVIVQPTLSPEGPWLMVETDAGLWATNLDGSGATQLTDVDYWDYNLPTALQPSGNMVAFISPAGNDLHHMALNMISLPDGSVTKITDLTSAETEAFADLGEGSAGYEALLAIRNRHNLAWTSDGSRLAFTGLMDGPSAEIYIYDVDQEQIRRVSTDDAQDYFPSWSPDGSRLVYFGTDSFSSGAVLNTTGVWLASGEELAPSLLYKPEDAAEFLAGWMGNTHIVLYNTHPAGGAENLRLLDLDTNTAVQLNEGGILTAAVDSWRWAVIYYDHYGLYLLTAWDEAPTQVSDKEVEWISPVDPGEYFFKVYFTDGSLATYGTSEYDYGISPTTVLTGTGGQDVSVWGWIWLWTSDSTREPGAWVTGPGVEIGRIFDDPAAFPIWDQDSNLFFFGVEGTHAFRLYRATFEAFYSDLSEVAFIGAAIRSVGWLGYP